MNYNNLDLLIDSWINKYENYIGETLGIITLLKDIKDKWVNNDESLIHIKIFNEVDLSLLYEILCRLDNKIKKVLNGFILLRNILIFLPIALTWHALSNALTTYRQVIYYHPDLQSNFLYLWETGFEGYIEPKITSLSTIALWDVMIISGIILLSVLIQLTSHKNNSIKLAEECINSLNVLMHNINIAVAEKYKYHLQSEHARSIELLKKIDNQQLIFNKYVKDFINSSNSIIAFLKSETADLKNNIIAFLNNLNNQINKSINQQNSLITSLPDVMKEAHTLFEKDLVELRKLIEENNKDLQTFSSFTEKISNSVLSFDESISKLDSNINSYFNTYKENLNTLLSTFERNIEIISKLITEQQEALHNYQNQLAESLKEFIRSNKDLSNIIDSTLYENMLESFHLLEEHIFTLNETLIDVSDLYKKLFHQLIYNLDKFNFNLSEEQYQLIEKYHSTLVENIKLTQYMLPILTSLSTNSKGLRKEINQLNTSLSNNKEIKMN